MKYLFGALAYRRGPIEPLSPARTERERGSSKNGRSLGAQAEAALAVSVVEVRHPIQTEKSAICSQPQSDDTVRTVALISPPLSYCDWPRSLTADGERR
jgi:hypothetical protein